MPAGAIGNFHRDPRDCRIVTELSVKSRTMEELQIIRQARRQPTACAMRSGSIEWSYQQIIDRSAQVATQLISNDDNPGDLQEARVAYLIPAGFDYISVQWGIWRAGGIAVPLSLSATQPELEYAVTASGSQTVITTSELLDQVTGLATKLGLNLVNIAEIGTAVTDTLPDVRPSRRAMILFTSGTTNKPKGVVSTHENIQSQIQTLVQAWEWQATDSIPLFLPLHHIHGIINIMSCALWSGATIEPFVHFDMQTILNRVENNAYTVFMAVPTIYVKLIQTLESLSEPARKPIIDGFAAMRFMVSGSAALPASVHEQWTQLTGQKLLERYGMTEIGMALSNPYHRERRPGTVGQPLPDVEIRLKSDGGDIVTGDGDPGEIQVRGPGVFSEYFNQPGVTAESFDEGWFRTGDVAVLEDGYYRIMGRQSVDIIKSGGYKLSALEIEAALLDHPSIDECAVIGVTDETWGEAVCVATVLAENSSLSLEQLREWCQDRLSRYKIPRRLQCVESLPRNAMGKITKPAVRTIFENE